MSIKLMALAWELDIPTTEKMVLLCLCDHANNDGICWPSAEGLGRRCSLTERTVRKAIKWLEENNWIEIRPVAGKVSTYKIDPGRKFTPEGNSGPPRKELPPTPEGASDEPSRTVIEPSDKKPSASRASDDAHDLKPEHFVESWNQLAKQIARPTIRDLTPERRQALKARINGYTIEDFRQVLGNIRASPFLRGEKRWSGVTFDWVTKKANFQKVLEGNYND
jgi:hypothetical protein